MAKLLIVDDEEVIRSTLQEILEYEDYETDLAADGKEGLDMLLNQTYDAVICDIKMPKMNGLELLAKSVEQKPETPVIMISGHGRHRDCRRSHQKKAPMTSFRSHLT